MHKERLVKISKTLSYILRHNPADYGVTMNEEGWVGVIDLLESMHRRGQRVEQAALFEVVETDDKQRFALNEDKTKIRASQGHTIDIKIQFKEASPPEILYHGTAARNVEPILREGLKKMERHHVHLSANESNAKRVGGRRGTPILVVVAAKEMGAQGYRFYLSDNHVWLVDSVPPQFLRFEEWSESTT